MSVPIIDETVFMSSEQIDLVGEGLRLRAPVEGDAERIADSVQHSLAELSPWMPWAVASYDAVMAAEWVRGETGDRHRFLMVDDIGDVVGTCGLNKVDEQNRSANLGYWVRSDSAGRGHATNATRLLARFGLDHVAGPRYHRLEVVMSTRNHASRRVAEKAGATFEGTLRGSLLLHDEFHDAHVWSLVSGDL